MRHVLRGVVDLEDGEVGLAVGQQDPGRKFAAVIQHDTDVIGLPDHVVIRHDDAVIRQDHARAERVLHLRPRLPEFAEKVPKKRVVGERRNAAFDDAAGIDIDHGRRRLAHHGRETERDFRLRGRHPRLRLGGQRGKRRKG